MSDSTPAEKVKTPWHLWAIGSITLLWNAMGAFDYFMTQTRNEDYMANLSPEQLEFVTGFPAWVEAAWAIGVWGGVLGSFLLLLRLSAASWVFLASVIAVLITMIHNYILMDGMKVMGDVFSLAFTAVIFTVALLLAVYARNMQKKGVLR